jgi:hypothetical protein
VSRFRSDAPQGCGYISRFAVLDHQRHDVKIDEAIFRIKNLHVTTERSATFSKRFPIEATSTFVEPFSDGVRCLQSEQFAGRIVQISNPTL